MSSDRDIEMGEMPEQDPPNSPRSERSTSSVKSRAGKYYKSCCFRLDPRFLSFIVQSTMAFLVVVFCILKLFIQVETADERTVYISLISAISAYFMPAPRPTKKP